MSIELLGQRLDGRERHPPQSVDECQKEDRLQPLVHVEKPFERVFIESTPSFRYSEEREWAPSKHGARKRRSLALSAGVSG